MRLFYYLFLSLVGQLAATRPAQAQRVETPLPAFNQQRLQVNRTGLTVLGGWAVGNLIVNGLAVRNATGSDRAFYQMNLAWAGVDLALAGIGLLGSRRAKTELSVYESLEQQHRVEKIFLINTGLDVAYVVGGAYLLERAQARAENSDRNDGYGRALLLQGGFLLVFDGTMYALHRAHFNRNRKFWQRLEVAETGAGMQFRF